MDSLFFISFVADRLKISYIIRRRVLMYDLIVLGSGPAGISSAIYAKRGGSSVLVIHSGVLGLEKATLIENYYGFPSGISGTQLYNNGIAQAKALGIEVLESEVLEIKIQSDMTFALVCKKGEFESKSLVIASGAKKNRPNIKGINLLEGHGVSYCAVCDGFFYRGKKVAVLGEGPYALQEAKVLLPLVSSLTILTDSKDIIFDKNELPSGVNIDCSKINSVKGDAKLQAVEFADGHSLELDGLFIAQGSAGASDFARKLGIMTDGDKIIVDADMQTNIPGVFAAGDCTGGLLQVSKAVYQGTIAGLRANSFARKNEKK